jgi:hypothetical protein
MKDVNPLLCGNLWQNLGDHQAGWELIRGLRSSDPQVREAVQGYLVGSRTTVDQFAAGCGRVRWPWKARLLRNAWSR